MKKVKKNMKVIRKKMVILSLLLFLVTSFNLPTICSVEEENNMELSHIREGGTPYNEEQSLFPRSIKTISSKDAPTSGLIESPTEYDPMHGVLYTFTSSYQSAIVTDLVVALTQNDAYDEIAYVCVSSSSQQSIATNMFTAGGANMSKVEFIVEPLDSIWIRDYGPHFIKQNGAIGIVDSHYYHSRTLDNFIPTLIGDNHLNMPTYDIGLYYSGGNFIPGPNRSAFVSELINVDNPSSQGFNDSFIAELYQTYQGIDNLHIMPQLPSSVDGTGHIDMWMNIVDEDTVIISKFQPGSNPTAIEITDNAVPYMESLGFKVYRTPAWNVGNTHYTYTNAFRVNDRYFIPYYASGNSNYADEDAEAFANFTEAAGAGVDIIPIDCYDIIPAAGAIHCIVMQVPRNIDPIPAVHVISPDGGEIMVAGTVQEITWVATDTYNREIPQIDLYYSTDDGNSFTYIDTTSNTGSYQWTVPNVFSNSVRIKVIATSIDSDQGEAVSINSFTIATGIQSIYDFSIGAGNDKFCWGYQTSSWSNIDNERLPVSNEIDVLVSNAYDKIAYSDATGSDGDNNRYISPNPSFYSESTHVYEFTISEDPADIDDIGILWEGYADACTQVELYVWDDTHNQWGDGQGLLGQNRYMNNWAGNKDSELIGHIIEDIDSYIDNNGKLTLLVYAERGPNSYVPQNPTFHDYISVIVSMVDTAPSLEHSPTSFNFQSMLVNETDQTSFDIWNGGIGIINYTLAESCSWLDVNPSSGNSSGEHDTIIVTVNTTGLALGHYQCDIEIASDAGNGIFAVELDVVAAGTAVEDVNQSNQDRGFPIRHATDGDWAGAQDFLPTLSSISKAEIYLRKFGTPEFDLVIELRQGGIEGTLIDTITFIPAEISSSWTWIELNFNDTVVIPEEQYYIVCPPAPSGVTTSFGYEWGYAFGNQYDDGSFWFTRDGGGLWRDLPTMYEFSFKTYGVI
jgi:agmatine deiminase